MPITDLGKKRKARNVGQATEIEVIRGHWGSFIFIRVAHNFGKRNKHDP